MKKKMNSESGFTIVEMLAVTVVMALLGLMVNLGMQAATVTYRESVAQSEVELLVSTAVDAIADDLRYAWNIDGRNGDTNEKFTYSSDSYGDGVQIGVDGNGRLTARGFQILPSGAYGLGEVYRIEGLTITLHKEPADPDPGNWVEYSFTIALTATNGKISASTPKNEDGSDIGVTVRCLNKMKVTQTGG